MSKTARLLSAIVVLSMVLTIVPTCVFAGNITFTFDGTDNHKFVRNGAYENGVSAINNPFTVVTNGSYDGTKSAFTLDIKRKADTGAAWGGASVSAQQSFKQLRKVSFWIKNVTADTTFVVPSLTIAIQGAAGGGLFSMPVVPSANTHNTWYYYEYTLTEANKTAIANETSGDFGRVRWNVGNALATGTARWQISDFNFEIEEQTTPNMSGPVTIDFTGTNTLGIDDGDYYKGNGANDKILWTIPVAGEGYAGASAGLLNYIKTGDHGSRKPTTLPGSSGAYKGAANMSFFVKNVSDNYVNPNFTVKLASGGTQYDTVFSYVVNQFNAANYNQWIFINVPITDSTSKNFEFLNHFFIYPNGTPAGKEAKILFSNITISPTTIAAVTPDNTGSDATKIKSVTVNNAAFPGTLIEGDNVVKVKISNGSLKDDTVTSAKVLVGVYETATNKLVSVGQGFNNLLLSYFGDINETPVTVSVPASPENYTLKVYLWKDLVNVMPYGGNI